MPLNNETTRRLRRRDPIPVPETLRIIDVEEIGGVVGTNTLDDLPRNLFNRLEHQGLLNRYVRASIEERERLLRDISHPRFALSSEKKELVLYEDKTVKIKIEDVVDVDFLGYFLKTDKRLTKDYYEPTNSIIVDDKYKTLLKKVFVNIDSNGNLLHNENYTYLNTKDYARLFDENQLINYIDDSLLNNIKFINNYEERIDDGKGIFYKKGLLSSNQKHDKINYRKYKGVTGSFLHSIKNIPNTFISTLGKKYSYGLEIETCSGILPQYLDRVLYYSAVHDGSLRHEDGNTYGAEYVTDILQGDLGLKQLKKLCYEITKRCLVNSKCGVHVHLSGIEFTKENIVVMYYLYYTIQDEVFSMLSKSRRTNEYCRYLDDLNINIININPNNKERDFYIEKYYNDIMVFLSSQEATGTLVNKKRDHPKGFKCGYDHKSARYCWANFIPAVFDTRRSSRKVFGLKNHYTNPIQTIEFRPMQASTSYIKIKNWLLICMALVDIVENHKQVIYKNDSINLDLILNTCYPKNGGLLSDYVEARKKKFTNTSSKVEIDDYQDNELDNDFKMKNL